MINIVINGKPVEAKKGSTIMEVLREEEIKIPALCYHPALEPYGACRMCMVEISQAPRPPRLAAACVTPCEEGMQIETHSPEVLKSRRLTIELLLAEDVDNPALIKLADELGVKQVRYVVEGDDSCILCGLCMRACKEIVGVSAISTIYRGYEKRISPPFQIESDICIGCGTCVLVCPTNAIKLKHVSDLIRSRHERVIEPAFGLNGDSNGKELVMKALRARQFRNR